MLPNIGNHGVSRQSHTKGDELVVEGIFNTDYPRLVPYALRRRMTLRVWCFGVTIKCCWRPVGEGEWGG